MDRARLALDYSTVCVTGLLFCDEAHFFNADLLVSYRSDSGAAIRANKASTSYSFISSPNCIDSGGPFSFLGKALYFNSGLFWPPDNSLIAV